MFIPKDQLRAFADRPWQRLEDAKREHIAEGFRIDAAAHAASVYALREHLRLVRPEWPTAEDLGVDLADHIAMKRKIDRVAVYFRDR